MSERIAYNPEIERRQEYTRRIVKAVNHKGNADYEDVPSILQKFQEEIVNELTDKVVEQLEEMYKGFCKNLNSDICEIDLCYKYKSCMECFYNRTLEILKGGAKWVE